MFEGRVILQVAGGELARRPTTIWLAACGGRIHSSDGRRSYRTEGVPPSHAKKKGARWWSGVKGGGSSGEGADDTVDIPSRWPVGRRGRSARAVEVGAAWLFRSEEENPGSRVRSVNV